MEIYYENGQVKIHEHYSAQNRDPSNKAVIEQYVKDIINILVSNEITDTKTHDAVINMLCQYKYILPTEFAQTYKTNTGRENIINLFKTVMPYQNSDKIVNIADNIGSVAKKLHETEIQNYIRKYNSKYFL